MFNNKSHYIDMKYIGGSIIKNGSIELAEEQSPIGKDDEIYEVLRIESGHPLFIEDHLNRWRNSMRSTGRALPQWTESFATQITWLILCNSIGDCDMRIVSSSDGNIQCGYVETVYPNEQMYSEGVLVEFLTAERESPKLKIFHAQMRQAAQQQQNTFGAYESLLVNRDGYVTEGSRSNVYFIDGDNNVHTAGDEYVLGGIMRKQVLQICKDLGINVIFDCVKSDKIDNFKSAFLSSTPMRILPIKQIASTKFDVGNEILRKIMDAMSQLITKQLKK